jgi:hypothetical protein
MLLRYTRYIERYLEALRAFFLDNDTIGVFADLFIELGGVMLISIPGFFLAGEWLWLTNSIIIFILATYSARTLRKRTHD